MLHVINQTPTIVPPAKWGLWICFINRTFEFVFSGSSDRNGLVQSKCKPWYTLLFFNTKAGSDFQDLNTPVFDFRTKKVHLYHMGKGHRQQPVFFSLEEWYKPLQRLH